MSQLNKTVLITGASGGMGKALVTLLRARGANFILVDRQRKKTRGKGSASIQEFHGVDVTDYSAVRRMASSLRRKRIKLDWVINLVGYADRADPLKNQTRDRINKLVSVNLLSIIYITRELAPLIRPGGGVVNVASTAGLRPNGRYAVYSAAKAGVIAFTQAMARTQSDTPEHAISFITLCPGPTNTPMRQKLVGDAEKHQSPWIVAQAIEKIISGNYRNGDVILVERGRSRLVTRQK